MEQNLAEPGDYFNIAVFENGKPVVLLQLRQEARNTVHCSRDYLHDVDDEAIAHLFALCVDVLRGEVSEAADNDIPF